MFLRYRMNKLIHLLERDDAEGVTTALRSDKYLKALSALKDEGCIKTVKDSRGFYSQIWLLDHYATYQLSREDVWANRIWGFVFGIATSVATAFIVGILPL